MDTTKLVAALDEMIAQDCSIEERIFLRLLKEVWQVDWTVAPYDVWYRMMRFDESYFLRFMVVDEGDEAEENDLIDDWIRFSRDLRRSTYDREAQIRMRDVIKQANRIRDDAQIE